MNFLKILIFVQLYIIFLFPQTDVFNFEHLSVEDGLSSSSINSIIQDKKGFLWIGTEEGLNRYDGYSFKIFKNDPEDSNSLSHNFIWSLTEDSTGNIWIATDGGGLNELDPVTGVFNHFRNIPNDSASLSSNTVQCVYTDKHSNLWAGTWEGGLNLFNRETGNFKRFVYDSTDEKSISSNNIFSIYEDSKDNLWILTDGGGANILDRSTGNFLHFRHHPKNNNSISSNNITCMCEDSWGNLWFGTYGAGLDRYNPAEKKFTHYKASSKKGAISGDIIWKIVEDNRGFLWVGTMSKGISLYDGKSDEFTTLKHDQFNPSSLTTAYIRAIYLDRSNVLWIGTMTSGLNKIDRKPQKFFHFRNELNNKNSLSDNFIFAICEDNLGDIWFGTYNQGVCRYNPKKNKFIYYENDLPGPKKIEGEIVRTIFEDSDKELWIGTYFGVLNKYNREKNTFIKYSVSPNKKLKEKLQNLRTIFEDRDGIIWFGTNGGGLIRYDKKKNIFSGYDTQNSGLSNDYILSICEDNEGYLWIGTYGGGLNKFNKDSSFVVYKNIVKDDNSISGNIITDLYLDKEQNLWAGTYSHGLNKYKKQNNTFIHLREKEGLASDAICSILEDDKGNIWVSNSKGISKIDRQTQKIKNYDYSDGITEGEFNPGAKLKAKNGWFYFGGVNGVVFFHPDSIYDNPFIPPVVITSIKKNNEEISADKNAPYEKVIHLSYNDYNFSFEFSALDYTLPEKNKYEYILEGFDKDWNYSGNRRYVSYTHLDPGEYTFKVKGTNNNGVWNEIPAEVSVIIAPPFWGTWWFQTLIIITFLSIGPIIYFRRITALKKEKIATEEFSRRLIQSQEDERKRIASELHDSLGQNLLILKNLAALGIKSNEENFKERKLEQISDNASSAIDEVRRISYNLHPYHLERLGLTKAIYSIIDNIDTSSSIKFEINCDNIDNLLNKEGEINFFRVVQEGVNNIIRHSFADKAEIKIIKLPGSISLDIKDNGKGFRKEDYIISSDPAKGFGIKNLQKRINILNGSFTLDSSENKGTHIKIIIPLKNG